LAPADTLGLDGEAIGGDLFALIYVAKEKLNRSCQKLNESAPGWNTPPPGSFRDVKKLPWCEKELHRSHRKPDRYDKRWQWCEHLLHQDHRERDRDDKQWQWCV